MTDINFFKIKEPYKKPSETEDKKEELEEPLKVTEPEKQEPIKPEKFKTSNLEDDIGVLTGVDCIKKDGSTTDISADIPLNTHKLTGVKNPTAAQDAATKKYVDDNKFLFDSYSVGDISLMGDITEDNHVGTSYTKVAEFTLPRKGTLRIKFDLKVADGGTAYGRVYRNGEAVGAIQSTASTTYVTKSEDTYYVIRLTNLTSDSIPVAISGFFYEELLGIDS